MNGINNTNHNEVSNSKLIEYRARVFRDIVTVPKDKPSDHVRAPSRYLLSLSQRSMDEWNTGKEAFGDKRYEDAAGHLLLAVSAEQAIQGTNNKSINSFKADRFAEAAICFLILGKDDEFYNLISAALTLDSENMKCRQAMELIATDMHKIVSRKTNKKRSELATGRGSK